MNKLKKALISTITVVIPTVITYIGFFLVNLPELLKIYSTMKTIAIAVTVSVFVFTLFVVYVLNQLWAIKVRQQIANYLNEMRFGVNISHLSIDDSVRYFMKEKKELIEKFCLIDQYFGQEISKEIDKYYDKYHPEIKNHQFTIV